MGSEAGIGVNAEAIGDGQQTFLRCELHTDPEGVESC
jgi:hypothetical protein